MKETVIDTHKKNVGDVELIDDIFATKVNRALIYEVVKMQRANKRSGTAATRQHCMVSGTTAKMYRQKGTGRARHGDARTNIFVGGGKAFGPHPRDYSYKLPKKARAAALRTALSLKKEKGRLLILNDFHMKHIKTKEAAAVLKKLGVKDGLIVIDGENKNLQKSVNNIPNVKLVKFEGLNVYDLMNYDHAVITLPALNKLQEALSVGA